MRKQSQPKHEDASKDRAAVKSELEQLNARADAALARIKSKKPRGHLRLVGTKGK